MKGWELIMRIHEKLMATLRTEKIKQQYVADKMGVTKSFLSHLLSGRRRMTAADFLAICMVLRENPADYMECDELAMVRIRLERKEAE